MNLKKLSTKGIVVLCLICISNHSSLANSDIEFNNKVNLALRQTGHNLLLEEKDSTSTIPPISNNGTFGFTLKLNSHFNYASLPNLVEDAFKDYNITDAYELMVKDCETDEILLGFNKASVASGNNVCATRDQKEFCANIFIQFSNKENFDNSNFFSISLTITAVLIGLGFLFYKSIEPELENENDSNKLKLGLFNFDPKNQILINGEEKLTLTFRENKLLHFFASQPNQVLTRSQILSDVWGDEGVIVGRSLDVFISRLRKLLKGDPKIQIKNVHAVGYKLEV
ncbi:MAG: response regulator transcription factor [Bacteroidia bacterium]|nr:response regulator transcription factor [Bacteroidia bacterium]